MKNYLAIIRKLDFVDLFKYGQFCINYAVPFDGIVSEHANDDKLFDALTSRMNMYEYSFEYLIIHFVAVENNGQYISIDIKNVRGVYTFDEEAKKEMSISFDPRIQLHISPWADKFERLQQKLSIKQSMRGVDNLWTIFGLPDNDRIKCEEIITPESVQEVFRQLYAYERPSGDLSIWTYLLRYERHSFYPKGMLGFFCDFIHVFCNFSKKQELNGEVAESTQLYPQLTSCDNPQFAPLYEIVKTSPLSQLTEQASGCRFAIAAPLFLFLKAKFSDGMEHKPSGEIISYSKKVGGFECSVAVYLLGLALGYDKTYDAFYESADLPFFKKKVIIEKQQETKGDLEVAATQFPQTDETNGSTPNKVTEDVQATTLGEPYPPIQKTDKDIIVENPQGYKREDLSKGQYNSNEDGTCPILWVRKKTTGKGKADVCPIFDNEDFAKKTALGYEPVVRFDANVKDVIASYGYDPEKEKKRMAKNKMK